MKRMPIEPSFAAWRSAAREQLRQGIAPQTPFSPPQTVRQSGSPLRYDGEGLREPTRAGRNNRSPLQARRLHRRQPRNPPRLRLS
ncbi:hypothetical protein FVF58_49825 [Paraburkholderia panacisoli]|uniref:Uncharacterized protein n=1 Tax=Paraburkholderia panacisoli TaxID=2603818 RepID=A0A5B0G3Y2_9BURK|nr:hypothetical protein FVF58_49825 [Paraburkholderia panacisoli]